MADKVGLKLVVLALFFGGELWAQSQANSQSVIAEVVGEFPYAYEQPDFDSPVIANLKPGTFYYVSKQQYPFGFHKVQLQKNKAAYVSSSEIKIVSADYIKQKKKFKNDPKAAADELVKEKQEQEEKATNQKPIYASRYRGLIIENQNFTEDTMSKTRSAPLLFFGYRQVGYNTLFSGEMSTDAAILFHSGAPEYYQDITGYTAGGWIVNAHFTFDMIVPMGPSRMLSYGFGPMLKYSHFETFLKNTSGAGSTSYTLDDLNLGAVLRVGVAVRWGSVSIRSDVKYFIESTRYVGINLSTLFVF